MTTLMDQSLKQIGAALRAGASTAGDLVETAVARHKAYGAELNAYYAWEPDIARCQAQAADLTFSTQGDLGPLQGIPTSVKDHFGVRGFASYAGTRQRLEAKWEQEGPVIAGLRRQLAVITGKTIAVELAFGGIGLNNSWGSPRNPWDAESHRVSGGSSSGAGVSLWEGSALLAFGTDTGGSVRIPASMTGTVGFKTGFGRWSLEGIVPLSPTLDTAGILTRSVADTVYAFAALDPAWGDLAALEKHIGDLDPSTIRIGLGDACMWEDCDPGIAEAVKTALDELARCGANITEISLPEAGEAMDLLRSGSVVSAECDAFLESELPELRPHLDPIITSRIADGGSIPAREYLLRQQRIRRLTQCAEEKLAAVDVIAAPTVPITPPRLAEIERIEDYRRLNMLSLRNTCVGNFLQLCGLSIPVGLDGAGLPVGLQLLARHSHEEHLLAVGLVLENILGTAQKRLGVPPLCKGRA